MGSRIRRATFVALLFAVGLPTLLSCERGDEVPNPLESRIELLASDIYDAAQWARRLPYELALPIIARSKIRSFVADLDLAPEVRERILARIDSRGFVAEIVPFALALRDVYLESEDWAPPSFDQWLRRSFDRSEAIPGFEHSMFAWDEEDSSDPTVPAFDEALTARLVSFYDALYLQEGEPDGELGEQLACARRDTDQARAPAAERVRPIVRELLSDLRSRVQEDGEMGSALDGILTDPGRLEAVSISLVHFLDDLVCRHYRIFATRVLREEQLARWMHRELDQPEGGRLWDYLDLAQTRRRYAALVVVDGLQGHLVQSLASGAAGDRFLERVRGEYAAADSVAPRTQNARAAPAQQIEFLRHLASRGFSDERYMSFFRKIYADPVGVAEVGVATSPTISVRNLPIAKTGAPVAGAGATSIPNFHFVDRQVAPGGRAYYFYGNDALQLDRLTREGGMRTLFDRLPAISSFSCAAQYDDGAHYRVDPMLNLALGEKIRDFGERRCIGELRRRAANENELRELRRQLLDKRRALSGRFAWWRVLSQAERGDQRELAAKLIDAIAALEPESMPELLLYYNPWPDHFAHFSGPFADEILAPSGELNRLDYWLGRLAETYREAGVDPRTLFAMAGDHGLTPVFFMLNPEAEVFDRLRERGIDFKVEKISSDEGEGPRLTNPLAPPSMRYIDAIVASTAGGNYMIDFFADQGDGWSRQPTMRDLQELRLISGGDPVDVLDEIYRALSESLDYLVVRLDECDSAGGVVAVIGPRGGERVEAIIERRGERVYLDDPAALLGVRVLSGYEDHGPARRAEHGALADRCLDAARRDDRSTWCDEGEWRQLTSYTGRPDSVVQLSHLYDTDRAGTVNLFPRTGIGYNTVVPGRHAGESFHEKDAFVGVWGAPVTRSTRPRSVVIGAAPATVYSYLADSAVESGRDGWGFDPIPLRD